MIDLNAAREGFDKRKINDIGHERTSENGPDALIKSGRNEAFERFLDTGILRQNELHWVVRERNGDDLLTAWKAWES